MPFRHLKWHLTFKSTPFLQSFFKQDMTVNNLCSWHHTQHRPKTLSLQLTSKAHQTESKNYTIEVSSHRLSKGLPLNTQSLNDQGIMTEGRGQGQWPGQIWISMTAKRGCHPEWTCGPWRDAASLMVLVMQVKFTWWQTQLCPADCRPGWASKAQHSPAQPYPRPYLPHVFDQKEPEALNPGFRWTMWHLQSEPGQEHEQVQEQQLDSSFLKSWQQLLLYACCRVVSSHTAVSHL